ncbi:AAA family ATPase [Brachyspira alvinipulli]|uniref:AAA family ATPase n=1 Tax=Brachyspira alvinipulli TaxID=84379 RepID=UPI000484B7EB|nr:AAA family ATPase [Brachyspira alvinipulli]
MDLNKEKINGIIKKLSEGLYEKEDIISFTFLCALAGKSVFLYGPPGTAKSLIVRRIASAFKDSKYFGQLMNRFTTPEDVFGPVSLSKLKEDKFERQTEGYLPKADFVFLDEIWKSSPAILNTLLTIINEKIYRNGSVEEKVPLKILVASSNETPTKGQGLEAMYDRFIMRLLVNPAEDIDNFKSLIVDKDVDFNANLNEEDKISAEYLESLKSNIEEVEVPSNIINIIISIKNEIDEYNNGNNEPIYISDRRWKNIVYILKASAYFSDRKEILPFDCFLISNCIWTLEENIKAVNSIVKKSIMRFLNDNIDEFDYDKIYDEAEEIKTNIDKDSISDRDEYENEININGKKYFGIDVFYEYKNTYGNNSMSSVKFYIEIDKINNNTQFSPLINVYENDAFNNASSRSPRYNNYSNLKNSSDYIVADSVFCSLIDSNTINIKTNSYYNRFVDQNGDVVLSLNVSIPFKFRKGDIKPIEYNKRNSYMYVCSDLLNTLNNKIESYESDLESMIEKCDSVFINEKYIQKSIYNNDYLSSLKSLKINIEHCIEKLNSNY